MSITKIIPAKKLSDTLFTDNWPRRRRWMMIALIWMMGNVQYMIVLGEDSVINQNISVTMLGAIVSILCFYVFGAVWDDSNKRQIASQIEISQEEADELEAMRRGTAG